MIPPTTMQESMTGAEQSIFMMFCKELQFTAGVDAYYGNNPGKPDVFVFALGELQSGAFVQDPNMTDYKFAARAASVESAVTRI